MLAGGDRPEGAGPLPSPMAIANWIRASTNHKNLASWGLSPSPEEDMAAKLFLDLDLSILATPKLEDYRSYLRGEGALPVLAPWCERRSFPQKKILSHVVRLTWVYVSPRDGKNIRGRDKIQYTF